MSKDPKPDFWEYAGRRLGVSRGEAKRLGYMRMYNADPAAVTALYESMQAATDKETNNGDQSISRSA